MTTEKNKPTTRTNESPKHENLHPKTRVIRVTIAEKLTFNARELDQTTADEIEQTFTYKNPAYEQQKRMGFGYSTKEPKIYKTVKYNRYTDSYECERGIATRLKKILEMAHYQIQWIDKRVTVPQALSWGTLELRENQLPVAEAMIAKHQCLMNGQTGTGKSETCLGAAIMTQQKTLVVVWNKKLMGQWIERIEKYGILKKHEIGIIGDGKSRIGPITVAMQQTLFRRKDLLKGIFGTLVLDEAQRASARTFLEVVGESDAKFRFGATADEKRKDRKHFLTYDLFGKVEATIEAKETIIEPFVTIIPTDYEDEGYEKERRFTDLINRVVKNKERNKLIYRCLLQQLRAGRKCLIFTDRVDAALYWKRVLINDGFQGGVMIGGAEYENEANEVGRLLMSGYMQFAVTTSFGEVGLDIPILDTAFFTCPISDKKRLNQMMGRIRRPHKDKKDAKAFYFWDRFVEGISKKVNPIKKSYKFHQEER